MSGGGRSPAAVILDIDGTLVDTNYHHALAWHRALRRHGRVVPLWRLHRHMGMGGDQLLAEVTDAAFDDEHGDAVRDAEKEEYTRLIEEAAALPGARELLDALRERGVPMVLASSAKDDEVDHYVEMLGAHDVPRTSSGDVQATKPNPELIEVALEQVGGGPALLLGDSVWDCKAATRAGVPTVGVLTGGFAESELREAGAVEVFASLEDVVGALDRLLTDD